MDGLDIQNKKNNLWRDWDNRCVRNRLEDNRKSLQPTDILPGWASRENLVNICSSNAYFNITACASKGLGIRYRWGKSYNHNIPCSVDSSICFKLGHACDKYVGSLFRLIQSTSILYVFEFVLHNRHCAKQVSHIKIPVDLVTHDDFITVVAKTNLICDTMQSPSDRQNDETYTNVINFPYTLYIVIIFTSLHIEQWLFCFVRWVIAAIGSWYKDRVYCFFLGTLVIWQMHCIIAKHYWFE